MDKIYVAKLGKTVGLKGDQKIYIDSDFPEQFKKNSILYTAKNQKLVVQNFNSQTQTIKFVGIDTIDEAKKLINKELYVTHEDSIDNCNLKEGQYFWFDLIGCKIIESSEVLGTIVDIQRLPLDDYFIIDTDQNLIEKEYPKSFMLPYVKQYVKSVNIDEKNIVVQGAKDILEAS